MQLTKRLPSPDALAYPSRTPFGEETLKLTTLAALVCLAILALPASAQQEEIPKNIADSVGGMLRYTEGQFLAIAEAMPEAKYAFIPRGATSKECARSPSR